MLTVQSGALILSRDQSFALIGLKVELIDQSLPGTLHLLLSDAYVPQGAEHSLSCLEKRSNSHIKINNLKVGRLQLDYYCVIFA
jgi:hypothetical protein